LARKKSVSNSGYEMQPVVKDTEAHLSVSGMYENWFLEYASYVILERAVPALGDGLKPVQRRILHAMEVIDDGRFNKVANLIGQTMQYHPHGDAAIGDALVGLGQKDLLIETQGNWGDVRTGDAAAASRYIEARLSKFAHAVLFNARTTEWQMTYDGRKKEPVTLPAKFPLLLAQGVEGIAVGLATKILPHNFVELIEASIKILRKQSFTLFPDFATGGMVDVSHYQDGNRGGKIRCRARLEENDKKVLIIREIPFGTTTGGLIDSILKANESGKLKVKKVVDNTAEKVEIEIHLPPGVSADQTMDALYAFTDCEVSISPNACVIEHHKPVFMGVSDILRRNTAQTVDLLEQELLLRKGDLAEQWHMGSLEQIFIEERIYRKIEECETWEAVLSAIDGGLKPFKKRFRREITRDDLLKLTEIKIKRISKYDTFKATEQLKALQEQIVETDYHLANLTAFAIDFYQKLLQQFGKGRDRKSEIRAFDTIQANQVALASEKLYVNRQTGFVGTGLRKEELVGDCSSLDEIIVFRRDGKCLVTKVSDKAYVGKDILWIDIFRRQDDRIAYNMIYTDGVSGVSLAKRFQISGIIRDKEYELTKGSAHTRVQYFSSNPNAESERVQIQLHPGCRAHNKNFDFDFAEISIKSRAALGNIVTKYPIKKVVFKEKGNSELGGRPFWFEPSVGRMNRDGRGVFLGHFNTGDLLIAVYEEGSYELLEPGVQYRFETKDLLLLNKWIADMPLNICHYIPSAKSWYIKRFLVETTTLQKRFSFVSEEKGAKAAFAWQHPSPKVAFEWGTARKRDRKILDLEQFMDVKGWKAMGNRLTTQTLWSAELLNPLLGEELSADAKNRVEDLRGDIWHEEEVPAPSKSTKGNPTKGKGKGKSSSTGGGEQQKLF
jgi:topoisomerase-4 subunit A